MRLPRAPEAAALGLLIPALLAGCGTVKSPTEPPPALGGTAFTFSQIQQQIFTPTCAKSGCHAASTGGQEGLILDAGQSYNLLVGHPATEQGTLNRVQPGSPETSYIILKLRGDPSISGQRMPQDGPPYLTAEQIDGIAGWIRAGAPNN
jgi:mono/diheme cytochrome c family protein